METFNFILTSEPHIKAKQYCDAKDEIHIDNEEDMKNFRLVMEIDELKRNARNKWIKDHQADLIFNYEGIVDTGVEFVDELNIYAEDNGEKLFTLHFGTTEEYEQFMKNIQS